ncbi:MAG: MFS transporter [Actinobacteria bacterium]|nr:MFS transporter [Actinomycetota bacterium]
MSYHHEVTVAAAPAAVRAAAEQLFGAHDAFLLHTDLRDDMPVQLRVAASGTTTTLTLTGERPQPIPYFQWFIGPGLHRFSRQLLVHAGEQIRAVAEHGEPPPTPKRNVFAPPAAITHDQAVTLATVCAIALVAGVGSALFGGNANVIADAFGISNRALSFGSAATRVGVLVGLIAAAVADRLGRRKALLYSVAGVCLASALSAVAPNFPSFVAAQVISRGLFDAVLVIASIVAIEEAPERARAYAVAMVTLAWGSGGAIAVVLLPLGDLGAETWRLSFAAGGALVLLVPSFARNLPESHRYAEVVKRHLARGRVGELFSDQYRKRIMLTLSATVLLAVLSAPSALLTNRFLGDEHDFSQTEIALFLAVVAGVPGLMGLVLGGRLAETRGRKTIAVFGTVAGTVFTAAFFVSSGLALWVLGTADAFLASLTAPALRALRPELFPTEVRGTANAAMLVAGLVGSTVGLVGVGLLSDTISLGASVAIMGVGPLFAALLLLPLPEPAGRELDVVSPPVL